MLALLGQNHDIDEKYQKCRQQCANLLKEIEAKLKGQDLSVLAHHTQNIKADVFPLPTGPQPANQSFYCRVRRRLVGHFGKIYALHWGNQDDIVSASQDGKLLIWNTLTSNKKAAIPLHSAWVMTCAYSPGGDFVASGGLDNICSVFNIKDSVGWEIKQPYRELQRHEGYLSCCRFVDNDRIITASGDSSCILWDIVRQASIANFTEHSGDVESVSIYQEKSIFVSGSIDATAKVWDYRERNRCIASFKGHSSDINSVRWFPDGNAFASGSDDSTCRLFDMRAHKQLNKYQSQDIPSPVTSVDFSKSGFILIAGYDEDPFCVGWDTCTTNQKFCLSHPTRVSCVQISPKGNSIATGCWDKGLRIWA